MTLTRRQIIERMTCHDGHHGHHGIGPIAGDHALNPDMALPAGTLTPAAVLIALVERRGAFNVLLTRRTDHLEHHPGQISFPGGHMDASDSSHEACALRELEEETGIPATSVTITGRLGLYTTRTGFAVTPVVGFLELPFDLRPDPREVAEVFEVPLDFLMDEVNHQRINREIDGKARHYYAIPFENHYIWGATAGMLVNLRAILAGEYKPGEPKR